MDDTLTDFKANYLTATTGIALFAAPGSPNSWGGGSGIVFIANATTAPSASTSGHPSGGGFLYVEAGYLKWKRRLQQHHADVVGQVLDGVVEPATIERVQAIVKKERLRSDPDVQALEDALCLVFVETQFGELTDKLGDDHMVEVVVKTLRKMSPAGREAALGLPLDDDALRIVGRALEQL